MRINEIDFNKIKSVKKKCICFAKDGNTVVKPYRILYELKNIIPDIDYNNLYIEKVEYKFYNQYFLWEELKGICIRRVEIHESEISKLFQNINKYEFFGTDGYLEMLNEIENEGGYINKLNIEVCMILGEMDLAMNYKKYREDFIAARESYEKAEREARELIRMEKELQEKEENEKEIIKAENIIKNRQVLINKPFLDNTIIFYLMKKYNVKVPLKTQGWINKALAKILYNETGISYTYYKGYKESTVFYKYLKELESKILESA